MCSASIRWPGKGPVIKSKCFVLYSGQTDINKCKTKKWKAVKNTKQKLGEVY
jgi:hypothetical protein